MILYIVFALIFIGCFIFYATLTRDQRYAKLVYHIDYPSDTLFSEKEFSNYIAIHCLSIIGKSIDSVNLSSFEKQIEQYPYISNADVINNRGTLLIKATQEKIIVKLFNRSGDSFFLAASGKLVPKTRSAAGRLVIANGYINDKYVARHFVGSEDTLGIRKLKAKHSPLYTIWKIAIFMETDSFWQAQIGQIYVNEQQEIELIPTVGDHLILFGNIMFDEDADAIIKQRLTNLKSLYTEGFKITGWDRYDVINLKYGMEIPCKKSSKP
jgi:cell division protein FtsQ